MGGPGGWTRIEMECGSGGADALEEALAAAGAFAVSLEEAGGGPRFESWPPDGRLWEKVRVCGLFPRETDVLARVAPHVPPGALKEARVTDVPEMDWVRAGRERLRPMRFGRRLWVSPTWAELPPEAGSGAVVRLDPGLAFGSGSHPTTRLCLQRLADVDLSGRFVVDYGCGSGILGIAALRLGAKRCVAVDVDPRALETARANAVRNRVAERFVAVCPDEAAAASARAGRPASDLLAANVLAGPLAALAGTFKDLVAPGGELMLAGILESQAAGLADACRPWFRLGTVAEEEGWVLLAGSRIRRVSGPGGRG